MAGNPVSPSGSITAEIKLRVVSRLLTAPRGRKVLTAQQLAAECGRCVRVVYNWHRQFRRFGYAGLIRVRSDSGVPRLYSSAEFDRVGSAASRVLHRGDISLEWRVSGLPGSFETFRAWVRRLQVFGLAGEAREDISA